MQLEYAVAASADSITVTFVSDGEEITWPKEHPNFTEARQAVLDRAPAETLRKLMDTVGNLREQLSAATAIQTSGAGVEVNRNGVFLDGLRVHSTLADRIMSQVHADEPVDNLINFLKNLVENPSDDAYESLYDFLAVNKTPITDDGYFLAFKRVRGDYTDIHSGKFSNAVGEVVKMRRNQVDSNRNQTCSTGLHVCSRDYLPSFGNSDGNRVVICKINPRDVVAVPTDYNNAKMRVCQYEVIGELSDAAKAKIFDGLNRITPGQFKEEVNWGENFQEQEDDEPDLTNDDDDNYDDENCDDCNEDLSDCTCNVTSVDDIASAYVGYYENHRDFDYAASLTRDEFADDPTNLEDGIQQAIKSIRDDLAAELKAAEALAVLEEQIDAIPAVQADVNQFKAYSPPQDQQHEAATKINEEAARKLAAGYQPDAPPPYGEGDDTGPEPRPNDKGFFSRFLRR